MIADNCKKCLKKNIWTVMFINLAVTVIKIIFVLTTHSAALLADSIESLGNMVITTMAMFSLNISAKERDDKHPYGYGKIDFLISLVIYFLMFTGSLIFIGVSILEIITEGLPKKSPSMMAAVAAAFSILGNYVAYKYCHCMGKKFNSRVIMCNALAFKIDILTSIGVIGAVVVSNMGIHSMDFITGILIGFWIVKISLDGLSQSARELMDFSPKTESNGIENLINSVPCDGKIMDIKTRLTGDKIWIEIEVGIPGENALKEGVRIAQELKQNVLRSRSDIAEVLVRLSPAK